MAPAAGSGRGTWRRKLPSPASQDGSSKVSDSVAEATGTRDTKDTNGVVTRDQFLEIFAQMELPNRHSPRSAPMDGVHRKRACPEAAIATRSTGCSASDASTQGASSSRYQVLLRGIPKVLMHENVMAALIKAGNLEDGMIKFDMRLEDKVLITFRTIEMVDECIHHFHDPQWAAAGFSISAMYVQTVKRSPALKQENSPHQFSIEAPAFVPSGCGFALSADTPAFKLPDHDDGFYDTHATAIAERTSKPLSADTPAFKLPDHDDGCYDTHATAIAERTSKPLSADAPAFAPFACDKDDGCVVSQASTIPPNSPERASKSDEEHEVLMAMPLLPLGATRESAVLRCVGDLVTEA